MDGSGAGKTFLELCGSPDVSAASIRGILFENPEVANAREGATQRCPLHLLCRNSAVTTGALSSFLQRAPGATKDKDKAGDTPLHSLCYNTKITSDLLSLLLERGPELSLIHI